MNDDVCISSFNSIDTTSTSNAENYPISSLSISENFNNNIKMNNIDSCNNNDNLNSNINKSQNDMFLVENSHNDLKNITNDIITKNNDISINSYNNNVNKNNDSLDICTENLYTELIDDVIFGLLLQIHRAAKLDYLIYLDPDPDPVFEKEYEIYDETNIFGIYANSNESNKNSSITSIL